MSRDVLKKNGILSNFKNHKGGEQGISLQSLFGVTDSSRLICGIKSINRIKLDQFSH